MRKTHGEEKPIFIPLRREWFEKFARGEKTTEYRVYGPRWNETTCQVGRKVVLSLGYGKNHRLSGEITDFRVVDFGELPDEVENFFLAIDFDTFAAITIKLLK